MITGRLTDAEKERIAELADQGMISHRVAILIDRHPSTVNYHFVLLGCKPARTWNGHPVRYTRGSAIDGRKGGPVRRFTEAEDDFIKALRKQGSNYSAIGRACGPRFGYLRPSNSIKLRLCQLAALE